MKPLIVCVHGCLGSFREFEPLQFKLAEYGFKSICPPLLGHPGHADGKRLHQVSSAAIVEDLATQLIALGTQPIVLIGHSLGGLLSLGLAPQLQVDPQAPNILGIATLGTPYDVAWTVNQPMGWLTRRSLPHLLRAVRYLPDSIRTMSDPVAGMRAVITYGRMRRETEWLFNWMRERLALVTVPTLLCHGQYDMTVPYESLQKLKSDLLASPVVYTSQHNQFGHQVFPSSRAAQTVTEELLWFIQTVVPEQVAFTS